jgi:hypothetical protein
MFAVGEFPFDNLLTLDRRQIFQLIAWNLLFYVTAGKRHIRKRERAISAGLITGSDAWVVTYAGQAHTFLVTECALVVVQVSVAP